MSFAVFGSILLLVATWSSGLAVTVAPRIIDGVTASPGKYLYQAAIIANSAILCGGSVLNTRYVLSAAHCFDGANLNALTVEVGAGGVLNTGDSYAIESVSVHNLYIPYSNLRIYDVAVVHTAITIVYAKKVMPVVLATNSIIVGAVGVVTGWGALSFPLDLAPVTQLRALNATRITNTACQDAWGLEFTIQSTHICTLQTLGRVCVGDDGDPLVVGNVQYGIVSKYQCTSGFPDVYTNIKDVYGWIVTHTTVVG